MTRDQFIEEVARGLRKYARQYGFDCISAPLSQACKESGFGTSELAINAQNIFGLKYKDYVSKDFYIKNATEQRADGTYYTVSGTKWCKFNSIEECCEGYWKFVSVARYSNLRGVSDYTTYLKNIKADNYCTSLTYVDSCIRDYIIPYNLTRFDFESTGEKKYWRVQTGAYTQAVNATAKMNAVKAAGFNAMLKQYGNLIKVQIGAYSSEANAKAMLEKVKAAGFDAFITYC